MGDEVMMGHRERITDGSELDWVSKKSRRILGWRPGTGSRIKRNMNKRARREAMDELTRMSEEMGMYEPGLPNPLVKEGFEGF